MVPFKLGAVLVLVFTASVLGSAAVGYADVPTVQSIRLEARGSQTFLVVEVRHGQPAPNHLVDALEVQVGDRTIVVGGLSPQADTVFTLERVLESASGAIRARAHCNVHGWSQWGQMGGGEVPPQGIPAAPPTSIVAALAASGFLLAYTGRRRASRLAGGPNDRGLARLTR